MLRLGVLDQLPVFEGRSPQDAVQDALAAAVAADEAGCTRFWVAEHHGDPSLACAAPEVLAAAVATRTHRLRVGTGCVLLSCTTPLRAAEAHRMLAALAPGRVDLGVGRASPGAGPTAVLLQAGAQHGAQNSAHHGAVDHARRIEALLELLEPAPEPGGPLAVPAGPGGPQVWVMGSGPAGALVAAALGLPLALAVFAAGVARPELAAAYRAQFRPRRPGDAPRLVLAMRVACAEDRRTAQALARCAWLPALAARGAVDRRAAPGWAGTAYPSLQTAAAGPPGREERRAAEEAPDLVVTGDPAAVRSRLADLARSCGTDEVVVTTACPDRALRLRGLRLLVEEAQREPALTPG